METNNNLETNKKANKKIGKRIAMSIIGVAICGISVGFFKKAAFGVDPFSSLMAGLDFLIPLDYGFLYIIVNAILLVFGLIFDRKKIGLATVINLFFLGYITQYSLKLLDYLVPTPAIWLRAIFLVIAILLLCFSSAMYFTADLGVSTYDAIAILLDEKWHIGPFRFVRIGTDIFCLAVGIALCLIAGEGIGSILMIANIGTIATAFFVGPLIDFFKIKLMIPFLNR